MEAVPLTSCNSISRNVVFVIWGEVQAAAVYSLSPTAISLGTRPQVSSAKCHIHTDSRALRCPAAAVPVTAAKKL